MITTELNKLELNTTKSIISIGLTKSADSLSFFIKEKVKISVTDIEIRSNNQNSISKKTLANNYYLLTTEIKGEIAGKAYLIFDKLEVEKIVTGNLPQSVMNNPLQKAEMVMEFLLEIDNIITASVITQFSNILGAKMYGDVPKLNILEGNILHEYLQNNNLTQSKTIYINSRFIAEKMDIAPEFIWLLEDNFFQSVKMLVNNPTKMELVNKLNIVP